MKISRKWRRLWRRGKPAYMKTIARVNWQKRKTQIANKRKIISKLKKAVRPAAVAASLALAVLAGVPAVQAMPTDGKVTTGQGSISQNGSNMAITQKTDKMGINWQSFNIAQGEKVQFVQPSSQAVALNRVVGNSASQIYGQLSANGKVFLINTNGILFSSTARVDVGSLVASTLNISDSDFMAGKYRFSKGAATGSVINQGQITAAEGGYVALLGEKAVNEGVIVASKGTVALGAGQQATLDMNGDGLINLAVNQEALNAQVENKNLIQADGGTVVMTAKAAGDLAGSVVNNSGVIKAQTLGERGGKIVLDGGAKGVVNNSGTLDASGINGANGGTVTTNADIMVYNGATDVSGTNGGSVSVNAGHITQAGTINANGSNIGGIVDFQSAKIIQTGSAVINANGDNEGGSVKIQASDSILSSAQLAATGTKGGQIDVLGKEITLLAATVDAAGTSQGGQIYVGGDSQGKGNRAQADTVFVNSFTALDASAKNSGNGGQVVVWSNQDTKFYGEIKAKGGLTGGNGGIMEVSGKGAYTFAGKADASAANGIAGRLLLDPKNVIIDDVVVTLPNSDIIGPVGSGSFGAGVAVLASGNILIVDPTYTAGSATSAGAAYLYDGTTGTIISSITGSNTNDKVGLGSGGIIKLVNNGVETGNFVIRNYFWNSSRGAVTWGNGITGFISSGTVSQDNSLVGDAASDKIGDTVKTIDNGNYFVASSGWHSGKGAFTWGSGTSGAKGIVSSASSLVGSTASDGIGTYYTVLSNNNIVVNSPFWDNGSIVDAGCASLVNGATGKLADGLSGGEVSKNNSLVGSQKYDRVGEIVTALTNGNYVVDNTGWHNSFSGDFSTDNITNTSLGAVTWGNGSTGAVGEVSTSNSLTGTTAGDAVGNGAFICPLGNGNYVVGSEYWSSQHGAVTWVNGENGYIYGSASRGGTVSASNSLVGSTNGDLVGERILPLTNNNYVVGSPYWDNGSTINAGAATLCDGSIGTIGTFGAGDSLVGSRPYEELTSGGFYALSNGRYVINDKYWNCSDTSNNTTAIGKVIWVDNSGIAAGLSSKGGTTDAASGLTGSKNGDQIGSSGIALLNNGNYVVSSSQWNSSIGAVTWVNGENGNIAGTTSPAGVVSSSNSLVGKSANDQAGSDGIKLLTGNNNYVVVSTNWNSSRGAVTWINGDNGNIAGTASPGGEVSSANSLVGSTASDKVGNSLSLLTNGNYIVRSSSWDNGSIADVGAVTWVSGVNGTLSGGAAPGAEVSASNSLVGTTASDQIGNATVLALANGDYIFKSSLWDNGTTTNAGAITWGNGSTGTVGNLDSTNSYFGTVANGGSKLSVAFDSLHNRAAIGVPGQNKVALWNPNAGVGSSSTTLADVSAFGNQASDDLTIDRGLITTALTNGTNVVIQANTDITVNKDIVSTATATGGNLTMQAGRSININANITTANGNLTLIANDTAADGVVNANRDAGAAVITMASGNSINAGIGSVTMTIGQGTGLTYNTSGDISLQNIIAHNITIINNGPSSGGILLNGLLDAGGIVSLNSSGAVSQSTPITAGGLELLGAGAYTLTNAGNSVGTIAANGIGSLNYYNNGALTIGNAGTTNGISATGDITLEMASGDITVTKDISSQASGDAIVIRAAAGADFINGSSSISANAGRWLIFADAPSNNQRGALTANFKQYNINYADYISNPSIVQTTTTGNGFIYNAAPQLTVGLTGEVKKTYDGTRDATLGSSNYSISGAYSDDLITLNDPASGTYDNRNYGAAKTKSVIVNGLTINSVVDNTGAVVYGYTLASTSASGTVGTIDKKDITIMPKSNQNKDYDRTAPNLANLIYTHGDLATGDSGFTGTLDLINGSNKAGTYVIKQGTLKVDDGNSGNNYNMLFTPNVTYTINRATLSISGLTIADKEYNGLKNAQISNNGTLSGILAGDTVTLSGAATAEFANKDAGANKPVNITGLTLDGADKDNYILPSTGGATGNVTAKALTITPIANNKPYDGTNEATVTSYGLSGFAGSETLTASSASASFDSRNAGDNRTVTVAGITLHDDTVSGGIASNYTVASSVTTHANISKKDLTITPNGGQNKDYDRTAPNLASLTYTQGDLATGDSGFIGTLDLTNGSNKAGTYVINQGTLKVDDSNSGNNYNVLFTPNVTYTINRAALSLSGLTIADKEYNGLKNAQISNNGTLSGILAGDTVTLSGAATAEFADKNVGSGKPVNITGLTLDGAEKDNYTLPSTGGATGNITAKALTITPIANNKPYDGTNAATVTSYGLSGFAGSETLTASSASASFDSRNAGDNRTVTIAGITLHDDTVSGGIASNYTVSPSVTTHANISKKDLTITPNGGQNKDYDRTAPNLASLTYMQGDLATGDSGFIGTLDLTNGSNKAGTYVINQGTLKVDDSNSGNNYNVLFTPNVTYTINRATLSLSGLTIADKEYNGLKNAQISNNGTLSGILAGDTVTLSGVATAEFADKNVGSGKPVNITGLTLDGAEKDNYTLPSTGGAIGNITAKTLTLNPVAANKTYDGTTAATLTDYGLNGLVGSETLQISSVSKFSDKNAGDKKTVTISAISLLDGTNGGLASNYHIDSTAIAVADIAKRPINVVGITAQDKTYDSTTAAILNTSGAGLTNTIAGDNVSLLTSSAKGTFSDGTVGNGKTVTVTELALSGTDIGNYQLAPYTTLANINNSQSSNQQTDAAIKTAITQPATEATSAQNNQSPTTSGTTTVVVEKGGVNNETTVTQPPKAPAPANQPTSAPNNQPSATGLAGALRVTSVGGTAENYSMTITNQSVIITLPSTGAQGANTAAPSSTKEVTASGVALVMVGAHGVETVVDTCNITATASSLTVTSVAGASTMQPKAERPSEQTSGAKTDTFKITKADGSVAEFSVTYAGGAISIKPLNAEAAELSKESGAGLKAVAATAILTAEDKLGVAASDVAAVYVQN